MRATPNILLRHFRCLISLFVIFAGAGTAVAADTLELKELQADIERLRAEVAELRLSDVEPTNTVSWGSVLTFTAPDDRFSLSLRGRIQPRYEFEQHDAANDHSSFSVRRARIDLRGHAYSRDLTWRIMPEWTRTGSLRDAWVNYRFTNTAQLRVGQYNVPFAWERDSSSNRHQFIERSTANNEFEWADGRDIGWMLHGVSARGIGYGVGVFGGDGRNVRRTDSLGNLFVGRVRYAWIGSYPGSEALLVPVEGINFATGLGAGYAGRNNARDWGAAGELADVASATADVHLQGGGASIHMSGFFRDVAPRRETDSFEGYGYTIQAGHLLLPNRLFAALRYSYSEPDTDQREGREKELFASLQFYQFGHGAKINGEIGRIQAHNGERWDDSNIVRVQYQLLF